MEVFCGSSTRLLSWVGSRRPWTGQFKPSPCSLSGHERVQFGCSPVVSQEVDASYSEDFALLLSIRLRKQKSDRTLLSPKRGGATTSGSGTQARNLFALVIAPPRFGEGRGWGSRRQTDALPKC